MDVTNENLDKFGAWLVARGRAEETAELYKCHVHSSFRVDRNPFKRLINPDLSSYTRRAVLAALKAWAKFSKDGELTERLTDMKMAPLVRTRHKVALNRDEWQKLVAYLRDAPSDPERDIVGLMAVRGFRVGDVLRMTRREIVDAVNGRVLQHVAKGGRQLTFGVTDTYRPFLESLASIKNWTRVRDLVSDSDNPKSAAMAIRRALKRFAKEAGLDPKGVYPHRLRRTVATFFARAVNGDLVKLKEWMQWTSVQTASMYVDPGSRIELDAVAENIFK